MPFRPYTILGLLTHSLILHENDGAISAIVARLHSYPPKLKHDLILKSMSTLHEGLAELRDYEKRGIGNAAFGFHVFRMNDSIDTALMAINEVHDPATKRTEQVLSRLAIKPRHFMPRYQKMLQTPLNPAGRRALIREFAALIAEIDMLIAGQDGIRKGKQ